MNKIFQNILWKLVYIIFYNTFFLIRVTENDFTDSLIHSVVLYQYTQVIDLLILVQYYNKWMNIGGDIEKITSLWIVWYWNICEEFWKRIKNTPSYKHESTGSTLPTILSDLDSFSDSDAFETWSKSS